MFSSDGVEAFYAVCRSNSFGAAAKILHISQSAVSQRIALLEARVEATLFVRLPRGVKVTESGEQLLAYCRANTTLQEQYLSRIKPKKTTPLNSLSGPIRIAGFSSVSRSVLLRALAPILHAHPLVTLQLCTHEMDMIPALLNSGEADFAVCDYPIHRTGISNLLLGIEQYVLAERIHGEILDNILDHNPMDNYSHRFFRIQKQEKIFAKNTAISRLFLNDIYGLLDGVSAGIGRAVVPKHLLQNKPELRQVGDLVPLEIPVWLNSHILPYKNQLFEEVIELLERDVPNFLKA